MEDDIRNRARAAIADFDAAADAYDRARPGYPGQLVKDIVRISGLKSGGRILEIGCGTGRATEMFAKLGYRILGLEPGPNLAARVARKCARYPNVEVRNEAFETWPGAPATFDLVMSAQAFHWVDPTVGFEKAAASLGRGGALAVFWNVPAFPDAEVESAIEEVYAREAPTLLARLPAWQAFSEELPYDQQIDLSGHFKTCFVRTYPWTTQYTAAEYVDLLGTQPEHRRLSGAVQARLFSDIGEAIEAQGGRVSVRYETCLFVAERCADRREESGVTA